MAKIYWPFSPSLVSEWPGTRPAGWADHVGTDFAIPQGTPLRATMDGTIDIIWNDGLGAWVIDIINPDGTVIRNGHLSYMAPKDGQWVKAGDYIGNTGGAIGTPGAGLSTGSHLHWEIRNNTGWGPWGWFDPRYLTILTFGSPDPGKPAPPPAPITKSEEDDMPKNSGIHYKRKRDGANVYAVANTGSGYYSEVTGEGKAPLPADYVARQAIVYDVAGQGFFTLSEGEAGVVKAACAAVRA